MSLLWRDHIGVELSPYRIAWVCKRRGLLPEVVAKGIESVSPQADAPLWQAALARLKQLMAGEGWKNAGVTVVLSNHLVRYDCLPWNDAVNKEAELLALARHRLTHVYGEAAQTWVLRMSRSGKGGTWPVAAMQGELSEMLKQATAEAGLKLLSIQPYLMASFNCFAKQLGQGEGWFVAAEKGRFALALFHGGVWQHIQLRNGSGIGALHDWLERENLACGDGASCRNVFLFAPELERDAVLPDYQLQRLELPASRGYSPLTDGQYSIAMSGIS